MRRLSHRDDSGLSLVELLVAMGITAVVLAGLATVFTGTMRATRAMNVRTSATADLRVTTEAMSRSLRVALKPKGTSAALITATSSSLTFYSLINRTGSTTTTTTTGAPVVTEPQPMKVEYYHDGTCLNEALTPAQPIVSPPTGGPYYTWPTAQRKVRCLMRTVAAPAFSYFKSGQLVLNGTTVAAVAVPSPGAATTPLASADLPQIQSVQVVLSAKNSATDVAATATIRVTLQNVVLEAGGS